MKICTFPNCAYLSETSRMIELYKEFKARGVEVTMATHGGPYEHLFAEEGIEYTIVEPHFSDERAREYVQTNTGEKGIREFYTADELEEHVKGEIAFYEQNGVDKVVSGFTLSCAISSRAKSIPYVVTHLGSFVPPVFEKKMLVPTLVTNLKLFDLIPKKWLVTLINNLMYKSKLGTKSFNVVASKFGVAPFNSMTEMMMGDLVVVTDVPQILGIPRKELESWSPGERNGKYYSRDYKLRYGGAIYAKLFGDIPENVKAFLDTDKPKIYVALTSGESEVLQRVYEGVKDLDARIIILTTLHSVKDIKRENILVVDHLPSHKIMPFMDLAIMHGGQGSIQTAIAGATPVIGIPLHVEQGLNVSILEKHGAGKMIIKHDIDPDEVKKQVLAVISDNSFKVNMEKLSKHQSEVDGVKEAVDIILK